jgi:hypothetical protein
MFELATQEEIDKLGQSKVEVLSRAGSFKIKKSGSRKVYRLGLGLSNQ